MLRSVLCLLLAVACQLFYHEGPAFSAPDGWAATYGGAKRDSANSIQQTRDEGYVVAGWTKSFGAGKEDVWVLKLSAEGLIEWQKTYGGGETEGAQSIQQTRDGGYIVAGRTESFGAGEADVWVLKLRPDGQVEWQKTYGGTKGDMAESIQQTSDGGYIVAGHAGSFSAERRGNAWVLKLRKNGNIEWQKVYGGDRSGAVYCIYQTRGGGYIMAGRTLSLLFSAGGEDLWVTKLRADGTVEWQKAYGGRGGEVATSIQQTSDGGYIVAGETESFGAGGYDAWVLKLTPDGTVEWQKTYGGDDVDEASSIQQTSTGGYVVAGWTSMTSTNPSKLKDKSWVLKLRPDGTIDWQKTYEGGYLSISELYSIQQARDGGYVVAGNTWSLFSRACGFLAMKLRPDGFLRPPQAGQDKPIGPPCESVFVKETSISEKDSDAMVRYTITIPVNSNATSRSSSAIVRDTDASVNFLYPSTAPEP